MTKEAASLSERSRWVTLAGLCLVCIVLGQLCDSYISTHKSAKSIFLLVYSFHMPAAMLLAGMASRDSIRERRYSTILSVLLLCLLTKVLIFVFSSLWGKEASFSLIKDSGVSSYAMALGICMLVTFFLKRFDPRGVMACAIILACFAGYDNSLGDTLALSRTVVLFPFFFAGYALDMKRLSETLSRNAVRIGSAVVLVVFLLLVYRFGAKMYWIRPLLTGRNPFSGLVKHAGYGWLLRFFYYPLIFCLIFAFLSVIPKRGLPVLDGIGKRAPSAFALCCCVIYLLFDGFGLRKVIGRLNGILFYLALLVISFFIAWLCAAPPLDKAVRRLITPQACKDEGQNNEASLSCFQRFETKQLLALLAVTFFLSFTSALYGPLTLFLGNAEDLWFSLKDVFFVVVPAFVLLSAVLVLIAWILPQKARGIYIRILFGVALALYVQGTYININYGVLDGKEIDWSQYTGYAIWSTAVWAVCIALPFLLDRIPKVKKNTERILTVAAAFLLIIQIPAMAVDLLHYKPKQGGKITVTTEGIYELSAKENLIMILFDSMDEQYFQSFLDAHPDYAANLDGFVHYDNTLSSGARTNIGMPSIMTGVPYTRQSPYSEYIESIWTDETPFAAMAEAGYDVRAFTLNMFFGQKAADSVRNLDRASQRVGSYSTLGRKLYKLDAFRFAPHLLKRQFWMDTEEFNEAIAQDESKKGTYTLDDAKFFRNYLKNDGFSLKSDYDKAFRLYHLKGPHAPYMLSSDGLDNSKITSREEQLEGNFALLNAILQDLKEKGLYDSCTIIVSADHGELNRWMHQMFLYKAPNASGAFTTSHAPVSMFDMYTMFYQAAGQEAPDNPYSMDFTTLSETETRERHAFRNAADNASRPIIREYVTTASAIEADKMTIAAEYTGGVNAPDTPYELGTKLSFAAEATGNAYAVEGFGMNNGFNTEIRGPYVRIAIPIANRPKQGELSVNMIFSSNKMNETGLKVYANGKPVADTELTSEDYAVNFSFNAEDVFEDGDLLTLEFEFDALPASERDLPVTKRTTLFNVKSLIISQVL